MIPNFKLIWLNIFVRLHDGRLLDIFNNYDGPIYIYVNIKYVHAINFN